MDEGNSVQDAKSEVAKEKFTALSILAPISGDVGLTCSPVTAIGIATNSW